MLHQLLGLERFSSGKKSEQAELILYCLYEAGARSGAEVGQVAEAFEALHLPKGNVTRISEQFRKSRNVRKAGKDS